MSPSMRIEGQPTIRFAGLSERIERNWREHKIEIMAGTAIWAGGTFFAAASSGPIALIAGCSALGAATFTSWRLLTGRIEVFLPPAALRDQILAYAQKTLINEEQLGNWNRVLEQKLASSAPQAKDAESAMRMDEIYPEYLEVTRQVQINLQLQFDLGQKFKEDLRAANRIEEICQAQREFQEAFMFTHQRCQELSAKVKELENAIVELLARKVQTSGW